MNYVDAHVHFWDRTRLRYGWLDDAPGLADRYLLDDYRVATADDPPAGYVFVQAGADDADGAAEVRWVDEMCRADAAFVGIVAWAPVDLGPDATARQLDMLDPATVRGVRRLIQGDPPGLCNQPGFLAAVDSLADRDLVFDVCILPVHLADALELARGAPETRLVLDHLAKPDLVAGDLSGWADGLRALGACPNVWCKLSGLVTEADPDAWTRADLAPPVDVALEAFGPGRLLWGSDWPVCTTAASHRRWREATAALLDGLSADERTRIMSATAADLYGPRRD